MTQNVVSEVFDRGVTSVGLLAQGHEHDVVEITDKRPRSRSGASPRASATAAALIRGTDPSSRSATSACNTASLGREGWVVQTTNSMSGIGRLSS